MESIFGNIVLPNVQVRNSTHHSRKGSGEGSTRTPPAPKQRTLNGIHTLEREREFRASFIGSEDGGEPIGRDFGMNALERQSSSVSESNKHHQDLVNSGLEHVDSRSHHDSVVNGRIGSIHDDVNLENGESRNVLVMSAEVIIWIKTANQVVS